ncbi:D-tyrosyl-tRNA(Tyr) deacylase [Candidatus Peregrinibacteria bacterium]|jgi:D-aminoacyl-tRNA deacylase|nr:D-tyrosyl-tRNA(Tyr) deacylase [Candidatus Peregrinibacteria bacterium]MBT7483523.1 D-tyrosyl-tRNA(Tyr) deacylase [Candidatus Peregrinibacteria bacterium]MBT7702959.1 D-tyrosyl-tRNA(Tyr) deacylase [Candidatus Peregrinibacteria bacterium]
MRVLLQRVESASVSVDDKVVGQIGPGLLLLVGVTHEDTEKQAVSLAEKAANLRIFSDEEGKMNLSLVDVGGEALVVSQFTLYGDCRKGRRPAFVEAAPPDMANDLYVKFAEHLKSLGVKVETGQFQAMMKVSLINDGPVTLMLEN